MHELAVCQALLDEVDDLARERGAVRVKRILLKVGPLSGVVPELLAQAFVFARAASAVARSAELAIEPTAPRIECLECGAQADATPNHLVCPRCHAWRTRLIAGDELLLQRIEFLAEAGTPPAPGTAQGEGPGASHV